MVKTKTKSKKDHLMKTKLIKEKQKKYSLTFYPHNQLVFD